MDYYSILGVSKNASEKEIRSAYKKKSMQHHPDRGGNEEEFKRVNEAYSTLKDPQKRGIYDHSQTAGAGGFHFNSNNFSNGQNPFSGTPFDHIFGQGFAQQHSRTPRNRDIHVRAEMDLADVLTGKNVVIQYRTQRGRIETVTVDIPPGAKHGDTVRYTELGDDGYGQYPRGDLHVKLYVKKLKDWERDGNNLITKKYINVFDLLLGCVTIVTTLDKKNVKLTIPQGTKIGQTFNIPGYGIPDLHTGKKGNLYVTIDANMPIIKDESILQQIRDIKNKTKGE